MNKHMANKGRGLEALVELQNEQYYRPRGIADIRRVNVAWVPRRGAGGQITGAHPARKSELDYKGTLMGGRAVSFDCKETGNLRGLPLGNIEPHQVGYMRNAVTFGELTFILCEIKPLRAQFVIPADVVIRRWNAWMEHRKEKGYGVIPAGEMIPVMDTARGPCDYLKAVEGYGNG